MIASTKDIFITYELTFCVAQLLPTQTQHRCTRAGKREKANTLTTGKFGHQYWQLLSNKFITFATPKRARAIFSNVLLAKSCANRMGFYWATAFYWVILEVLDLNEQSTNKKQQKLPEKRVFSSGYYVSEITENVHISLRACYVSCGWGCGVSDRSLLIIYIFSLAG